MSIVITGLGLMSAAGDTKDAFIKRLSATSPETPSFCVKNFDIKKYFNKKGLRGLDYMTQTVLAACIIALSDSGFIITDENRHSCSVALGTAFGSLKSIWDFDVCARTKGFSALMPGDFVNAVMNAPAGHIAILLGMTGKNVTLSSGGASAFDSIIYCVDTMEQSGIDMTLCGGAEAFNAEYCEYLSTISADTGISPGDGAGMLVLERDECAKCRGAHIYADILGYSRCFLENPSDSDIDRLISSALSECGISRSEITAAVLSGKTVAISSHSLKLPDSQVIRMASFFGETYSAAGAFSAAAAVLSLEKFGGAAALLHADYSGSCSCIILKRT